MDERKHPTVAPTKSEILIVNVIPKIEYNVVSKAEVVPGVIIDDEIVPEQFIPTSSLYLEDYIHQQELLVCRACLLSECRLYSMRGHNLEDIYRCLTNAPLLRNDNIPLLLCAKCACFLDKCQQFRQKANIAQEQLYSLAFPVTYKQIKKTYDEVNKKFSSLTVRQIPPEQYDYCISESCIDVAIKSVIKEEIKSDDEGQMVDEPSSNLKSDDEGQMDDEPSSNLKSDETDDDDDDEPLAKIKIKKTQENDKEPEQKQDVIKRKSNLRKSRKQGGVLRYTKHNLINKFTKKTFTFEEQIAAVQKRKESYSYKFFKYKCDICFLAFNDEKSHKEHMARHDKDYSNYLCDVCHLHFHNHEALLLHKRTHKWLYSCVHCSFRTNVRDTAVKHIYKHEDKNLPEDVGSNTEESKEQPRRRVRPHSDNVRVVCEVCGKYMTIAHYRGHMDEHEGRIFKCVVCGKQYNNSKKYKTHIVNYHTGENTTCPYCGNVYSTKWIMKRHIVMRHTGATTPKRYPCEICGRPFQFRYGLKQHYDAVHLGIKQKKRKPKVKPPPVKREPDPEKPFVCEHCYKGFKNKPYLQQHLNFVHYKKPRARYKSTQKTKKTALEDGTKDEKNVTPTVKEKSETKREK